MHQRASASLPGHFRHAALSVLGVCVLGLNACSRGPEPADKESPEAAPAVAIASGGTAATPASSAARSDIPTALRGRWGLVPDDCTSTHGDAKGLLEVEATSLRFFESSAQLGKIIAVRPDRIRANYAFSGEGQEWTQDVELRSWDSGAKLIRQDHGPDALPGPLTYTRCAAP